MVSDLNMFSEINKVYEDDKEKHRNLSGKGKARTNEVMNISKILYVGTVEGKVRKSDGLTTIASRTFQHLGFYDKGSTGGLHLLY
ncbi:hypothetical protein [uncultured Aquimarina sp.]|uniref:hypothetical protein n=1 Tax=uncultured Aquimarina sp. TaxID=575652 RepID=UPI002630E99A|nr:hypothetical protein [uncultured Aquimarina sp.]